MIYSLLCADFIYFTQICVAENALQGFHQSGIAFGQSENGNAANQGTDIKQGQLDDAAHAGTPNAAKNDIDNHQSNGNQGRDQKTDREKRLQQGRGRQNLCNDTDENAQKTQQRTDGFGFLAVFFETTSTESHCRCAATERRKQLKV